VGESVAGCTVVYSRIVCSGKRPIASWLDFNES
jgi:hypothetical protein